MRRRVTLPPTPPRPYLFYRSPTPELTQGVRAGEGGRYQQTQGVGELERYLVEQRGT